VVAVVGKQEAAALDDVFSASRSRSLKRTSLWPVMNRKGKAGSSSESAVMTTSSGYTGMFVYSTTEFRTLAATLGL